MSTEPVAAHKHRFFVSLIDGLPLILILACIGSIFMYQGMLIQSVQSASKKALELQSLQSPQTQKKPAPAAAGVDAGTTAEKPLWNSEEGNRRLTMSFILSTDDQHHIDNGSLLMLLYLSIFLCAEGAFVMMALREYLQDGLKLSDMDVIKSISAPVSP